ncbi:squalene synthase HpnC [Undibacterium terreum]|uniref:Squalene synthase HpnC n=1 Tax=Undibacterium terreum TaxID=1224302 RepID=A0A916U6X8_9BURK|nr:squalene synthase HpnC [Undibacterium terreum]GGC59961.1 squalene synthase HpnC [Undibacterium terreum]
MPVEHYENFPVASVLLPARLRPAVESIYAFARTADDIADEGDALAAQRLAELSRFEHELDQLEQGIQSESGLFRSLAATIEEHRLPVQPFRDLLSAFKQDVVTTRYADFDDLLDYCRRSANPVGALMLHLYRCATPEDLLQSDAICSALQLINFWQDVAIDWKKQRIYIPQEDLQRFQLGEQHIAAARTDEAWQQMMRFQTARARAMLMQGSPLAKKLPGRIGWELRLVVQGGLRILEKIDKVNGNVFTQRPKLVKSDWLLLLWRAARM